MPIGSVRTGGASPTVHWRDWLRRGPVLIAGSRTESEGSETVTPTVSPVPTGRVARSRLRLLWVSGTTAPFSVQVTSSSWYFGCGVSTHTTSVAPTMPAAVDAIGILLALRRPVIL